MACKGKREHVIVRKVTDRGRERGDVGQDEGPSPQKATEFGTFRRGHVVAAGDARQEERARDLVQDCGRNDQAEVPTSPADHVGVECGPTHSWGSVFYSCSLSGVVRTYTRCVFLG
jgi:hypothetical protein